MLAKFKSNLNLIFSKGWYFLRPQKKPELVSFVFLTSILILFLVFGAKIAHADILPSTDDIMGWFADILFAIAGFLIKLTFFVLKFIIEVAGYNGFIDSPAVIVGWVMVRDITNMFFVVVLLVISFGTILGLEQYEYKKLLVKLLMAAIVVNFSRIICGLIIDIAQVVMITFVNGIAATASGNLVNMFQVDQIFKLSGGQAAKVGSATQIFLAGVAAITFATIMLVTMLTFLFLIMARMAMLWVLIVLSPFAFVLNVLPQTEKYASQWWGEFGGHVVAGPIIAFFLWLSFVTVGSGSVHDEITKHNALPANQHLSASASEEEQTGITQIMTWEKMANFVIAIAMLLAGAKMAQQLGVVGGSLMGKAGELGKKVALYASGIQAARWTAGKVGQGAKAAGKFALMKAPIIGGEEWQRRGRAIKAWASYKTTKKGWFGLPSTESRLIAAGKRVETAYGETGKGKPLSRAWARLGLMFAPTEFKEEYTKDRESRAKYAYEQMEHIVSTSKTPAGKEKTEAEADLEQLKETGQAIKAEKIQKVREAKYGRMDQVVADLERSGMSEKAAMKQIEESGEYTDRELFDFKRRRRAIEGGETAAQIKEKIEAQQKRRTLEQREKLLGEEGGKGEKREEVIAKEKAISSQIEARLSAEKQTQELIAIKNLLADKDRGEKLGIDATNAKAILEQVTFDSEQVKALKLALARDKVLTDANRYSEANNYQNTLNAQAEERMKKHSGSGDYVQSVAKTIAQIDRIDKQKKTLSEAATKEEKEEAANVLRVLERSLSEMQISNLGAHAAVADGNKANILKRAKMSPVQDMSLAPENIMQLQAQDLAELINDKVEATQDGLKAAMDKLKEIHGPQMANAVLELKRLRNDKAAGQGSLGRAGLYNLKDNGDGTFETVLTKVTGTAEEIADGLAHVQSRRTSGLSGSKITNVSGFGGSMDRDSAGKAVVKSPQSKEILVKLAAGITGSTLGSVDEYTKGDLAEVLDNSEPEDVKALLKELKEKVTDKRGLDGLLNFARERMKSPDKIQLLVKVENEGEESGEEEIPAGVKKRGKGLNYGEIELK